MVKNIKSKFSCLQEYVNHHVISVWKFNFQLYATSVYYVIRKPILQEIKHIL